MKPKKSWIPQGYDLADESFIIHADDIDLTPIEVSLPKAPSWELIVGHGLLPRDQFFQAQEVPPLLVTM